MNCGILINMPYCYCTICYTVLLHITVYKDLSVFCLFIYRDVSDKVEYLSSLGRAQTAVVIRDADIAIAEAERDATIKV